MRGDRGTAKRKFDEGWRLFHAGDFEGAAQALTEAIGCNPGHALAYHLRAQAYRRLGREAEARADSQKEASLGRIAARKETPGLRLVALLLGLGGLASGLMCTASLVIGLGFAPPEDRSDPLLLIALSASLLGEPQRYSVQCCPLLVECSYW
jgi:tetratricopeptide (TPR) repeat protein